MIKIFKNLLINLEEELLVSQKLETTSQDADF